MLVVLGHPRRESLGGALFDAFCAGLAQVGIPFRTLELAPLRFDPDVHHPSPRDQALEPDLEAAQEAIQWADHLVFIYPTWWGTLPARLKGFLDRVLTPGFAFTYRGRGRYTPLLQGKTTQLITTMDTPAWVYRGLYGSPGHRAMARATLGFCGVRTVRTTVFGPVVTSSAEQRTGWLERARQEGAQLDTHTLRRRRREDKVWAWGRALRLQFYPMTWMAYSAGALAADTSAGFDLAAYWIGYLALFFLEAATVFSNDYFDFESDRRNANAGPFTGGSRVLVDGALTPAELRAGIGVALATFVLLAVVLVGVTAAPAVASAGVLVALSILALGYTVPPLKLSHRGLGELDVAVTHSIGVILCGYVVQGGGWQDPMPWLLGLPLLVAILPAITLSGVPDLEADRAAGKRTLTVTLGARGAIAVSMAGVAAAVILALVWVWQVGGTAGTAYQSVLYPVLAHSLLLLWLLGRYLLPRRPRPGRIDGPMALSLSFILRFALAPLIGS